MWIPCGLVWIGVSNTSGDDQKRLSTGVNNCIKERLAVPAISAGTSKKYLILYYTHLPQSAFLDISSRGRVFVSSITQTHYMKQLLLTLLLSGAAINTFAAPQHHHPRHYRHHAPRPHHRGHGGSATVTIPLPPPPPHHGRVILPPHPSRHGSIPLPPRPPRPPRPHRR
jgi:hypothetical protein